MIPTSGKNPSSGSSLYRYLLMGTIFGLAYCRSSWRVSLNEIKDTAKKSRLS
jgi:hypothetical protein